MWYLLGRSGLPCRNGVISAGGESRPHVHIASPDGEAKFWLAPEIELARSHGLTDRDVRWIRGVIDERETEIRDAWNRHFGG